MGCRRDRRGREEEALRLWPHCRGHVVTATLSQPTCNTCAGWTRGTCPTKTPFVLPQVESTPHSMTSLGAMAFPGAKGRRSPGMGAWRSPACRGLAKASNKPFTFPKQKHPHIKHSIHLYPIKSLNKQNQTNFTQKQQLAWTCGAPEAAQLCEPQGCERCGGPSTGGGGPGMEAAPHRDGDLWAITCAGHHEGEGQKRQVPGGWSHTELQ